MDRSKVTVQIMMGGKSTRMGTDKALVKLGGKTLLERAVERWRDYGGAIQLSVGPEERTGLAPEEIPTIVDLCADIGPIAGLYTGLQACKTEYLLLVAVDFPFVTHELADALLEVAEEFGCDACTYLADGRPQPLFSLYRTCCQFAVEELLRLRITKMRAVLDFVYTERLVTYKIELFRNVNTPEELAEAEKQDCAFL